MHRFCIKGMLRNVHEFEKICGTQKKLKRVEGENDVNVIFLWNTQK